MRDVEALRRAAAGRPESAARGCRLHHESGRRTDSLAAGFIENRILEEIDGVRGTTTPPYDLDAIALQDPYVDWDGDGWVPGPDVEPFDVGVERHAWRFAPNRREGEPGVAGVARPFDKNPEKGVNKVVFNFQSNKPRSVPGRRPRPDGEQGLGDIRPRRCQGDSCAET